MIAFILGLFIGWISLSAAIVGAAYWAMRKGVGI